LKKRRNKSRYSINVSDLPFIKINHGQGLKKVFVKNEDTETDLTQFAYSRFKKGDTCKEHLHPTMDEYFYVLSGGGIYQIGDDEVCIKEGDFIKIKSKIVHSLLVNHSDGLELIYFGIQTSAN